MSMSLSHTAFVPVTGSSLLDPLAAIAQRNGFGVDRRGNAMVIDAPLGGARFDPGAKGTQLTLTARTPAELQLLTDLYADRLEGLSLGVEVRWNTSAPGTPLNQVLATVIGVMPLSPNFARVRLAGDFAAFKRADAGLHFRLLLHPDQPGWPIRSSDGVTQWPGGIESWHRPPYTVRRISAEGSWIDVDIVRHKGGRVTEWCDWIAPGDEVALHGPSGSKQPGAGWLGLLGDETALPVILRIIEDAPPDTGGMAFIAIRHPDDAQDVKSPEGLDLHWLDMNDEDALIYALNRLDVPETDRHILFAAERSQAAEARDWLHLRGLTGPHAKAAAYWTRHKT